MAVDAHLYDSLRRRLGTLTAELASFRRRHDVGGGTSVWEPDDDALLVFHAGPLGYAIPAATVREVVLLATFTAVPGSPSWLLGLLDLPGEPVPVLDVTTRLRGTSRAFSLEDTILIVETGRGLLGLLVEGGDIPKRVEAHLSALIKARVLRPLSV